MMEYFYPLALSSWDQEEIDVSCEVIRSTRTTMGVRVSQFQNEFSQYIGSRKTYMVNSGSSANLLMAMALKVYLELHHDCRRTILIPAVGWSTSYAPFIQLGFNVKLVDVSLSTYNIDLDEIICQFNDQVVAVLAINILGNPCFLEDLSNYCDQKNIFLLEDNCESLGAEIVGSNGCRKAGNFGIMASHSFFFSHHINTMEGGCVCTSDDTFALLLKILRNHGWVRDLDEDDLSIVASPVLDFVKQSLRNLADNENVNFMRSFYFLLPGFNLRPTEIQGALGSLQLKKLPLFIEKRRENARLMRDLAKNISFLRMQNEVGRSSFFGFGFIVDLANDRDRLSAYLDKNGVQVRPIVSGNIAKHPLALQMNKDSALSNASTIHESGFFVGNHHVDFSSKLLKFADLLQTFK